MTVITHHNSPYKVSNGITDTSDVVSSGGSMYVLSGGYATDTTVASGGLLTINSGGSDLGTEQQFGGVESVHGLSLEPQIAGRTVVAAGGTDVAPTIHNGGVLNVLAHGTVMLDAINFGTLETTASGAVFIPENPSNDTIYNTGKVGALGTNANLVLSGLTISSTPAGSIFASGAGARVVLEHVTISGGTLATSGAGAMIQVAPSTQVYASGIAIAKGSLFALAAGADLDVSGTINNSGTITLGKFAEINLPTDFTLTGGGKVEMAVGNATLFSDTNPTTFINVNNTIAGAGNIGAGNDFGPVTLVNGGTIDSNIAHGMFYVAAGSDGVVSNSGALEATNSATFALVETTVSNTGTGTVKAGGPGARLVLDNAVIDGGTVKAAGGAAIIAEFLNVLPGNNFPSTESNSINSATIAGGSPIVVTSGGSLFLEDDTIGASASIKVGDHSKLVVIGGTIGPHTVIETMSGGTAQIAGAVTNSGTFYAQAAGSLLEFVDAGVSGGVTKIDNGTALIYGGEAVVFQSGGTGDLELINDAGAPSFYSGTITGFGQNIHQSIDLVNVASGADVSASYTSNTHNTGGVLTITSGATVVADITLSGHYTSKSFKLEADISGKIEIVDPPVGGTIADGAITMLASSANTPSPINAAGGGDVALLGSYMAALFSSAEAGIAKPAGDNAENQSVLVHPHTG